MGHRVSQPEKREKRHGRETASRVEGERRKGIRGGREGGREEERLEEDGVEERQMNRETKGASAR